MRLLLVVLLTGLLATPAHAAFPGRNGDLIVSLDDGKCELGSELFATPPSGGSLTQLTHACGPKAGDATLYAAAPDPSPDGATILSFSNTVPSGVVAFEADGQGSEEILVPQGVGYDDLSGSAPLSYSPSGASFAAAGDDKIYEVTLDGSSEPRVIVADPTTRCAHYRTCSRIGAPRWSPDGKLLAVQVDTSVYKRADQGSLEPGLWLINARSGRPVRRIATRAIDADWSPDSKRLVYATGYQQREVEGGASGGNLFVVDRTGRHRRSLVHREDIAETQPVWSPDGTSVAWISLSFSAGDVGFRISPSLWKVSVRTKKRTRLRSLKRPFNEEGYYHAPELAWPAR